MKFEELTIQQVVETCYNTKFCNDCNLHNWCNQYLEKPPTDWRIHGFTNYPVVLKVKEVQDDQ